MIVQAVDGRYYVNPCVHYERAMLICGDKAELYYLAKKPVRWKTARQKGMACGRFDRMDELSVDNSLRGACVFEVKLSGPIPVPAHYGGILCLRPAQAEHEVLFWTPTETMLRDRSLRLAEACAERKAFVMQNILTVLASQGSAGVSEMLDIVEATLCG